MKERAAKADIAVSENLEEAVRFLREIIAEPSVEGAERPVQEKIAAAFAGAGLETSFAPLPESLRADREFTSGRASSFKGRENVVAVRRGSGGGRSLVLNTHSDVVPAGGWSAAFRPEVRDGFVWGRGAVDAKGQVATILLAVKALAQLGVKLSGDLEAQVVIDEEVGGNGTLALLREGRRADAAVVMEPTSLRLHGANRGALWFRFTITGEAAHMARKHEAASAIDYSIELINILYRYEKDLLEAARENELFSMHKNPVQVNVGRIEAGDWPATVAAKSVIEGGVGFLPGTEVADIKRELAERVDREGSGRLRENCRLEFPGLHNEAFETPLEAPLVKAFQAALANTGLAADAAGWIASCDARLFSRAGRMDTIVFGPGDLALAHSERERIDPREMEKAACALVRFIIDWCR